MPENHPETHYRRFLALAASIENDLIRVRRHLRQFPELSWNEQETSAFLQQSLLENGISCTSGIAVNGFYTDFPGVETAPLLAWRADIDALPIEDKINTSYASKVAGYSHACGHDVHSTIAYGIARVLHASPEALVRPVRVLWQPAEESLPSGAPAMVKDGVLEGVEAIMALHCDPTRKSGTYGIRAGAETASVDTFIITVDADATTHSARPFTGKDTVWIMHQIMGYLYAFGQRRTDVRHPSVLSICQLHAGQAHNVIPKTARCSGTLRTTDPSMRSAYLDEITQGVEQIGRLNGANARLELIPGAPAVINHPGMAEHALQTVRSVLGDNALDMGEASLGAEDFAYYLQHIPGLFIRMGTCSGPETAHPLHSSYFDIDESTIVPTVALMATLLSAKYPIA